MARLLIGLASISGFLSVAFGAFGAHALKNSLDDYSLRVFHTGVDYQFWHSLALLLVGILCLQTSDDFLKWVGLCFATGILIFSGSLYLLAITQIRVWGAVTPIGGIFFLIGWALLAYFCFYRWNVR